MRRMRDVDDALEPGIKAPARCSRGCGMMGRFWCLSLWLRAPLLSLFTLYNPWLGRVSRMLAFYCHLAGPLWILAAWYDFYAEGFSECDEAGTRLRQHVEGLQVVAVFCLTSAHFPSACSLARVQ